MSHIRRNILSDEELNYLNNLPEVIAAKASLDATTSGMVYFSVPVTDLIRDTLQSRFELHIATGSSIPMRWIKGDTAPHMDVGPSNFKNTYLLYLNDSPGELVIDSQSYPIEANTGFVFNEGLSHETKYTEDIARLLLGPMNEFAEPVGSPLAYYPTLADALADTNTLGYSGSYTIGDGGPYGGYTSWRIASNSSGTSPQNLAYANGTTLINYGSYYLYPDNITRYYIQLSLPDVSNSIIFTGFFYIDNSSNIVQTFYDSTNPTVNIRSTGNTGGPTYLYYPGWLCFDGGGCNVTSFPYLYGATLGDYNLYGNTSSSTHNSVNYLENVTYEFSLTIIPMIAYYPTQVDALADTNVLGYGTSFEVGDGGPFGGHTTWRLASNSTGTSPQNIAYANGSTLINDGAYFAYPNNNVFYYPTEADALASTNLAGGLVSYVINGASFGVFTRWIIASNSTGTSSQSALYQNGSTLNNDGVYFLYPPILVYYPTEADAIANTNRLGYGDEYLVGDGGPFGPYTSWRIASNSTGTSPQNAVYPNGTILNDIGSYFLYPLAPCFLEGSAILCQIDGVDKYVPVERMRKGTLVKTSLNGYKTVVLIGKGTIQNPGNDERTENRLYRCSPYRYPQLKDDLYITGCHSILESVLNYKQRDNIIARQSKLFVTDNKYRLMACLDDRAEPWNSEGAYTIWHFALENPDEKLNYGVYANGGLLVESCSIVFLREKSNMEYIE